MSEEYLKQNKENIDEIKKEAGFPEKGEKSTMKERVGDLLGRLEEGLKEVFESDKYKDYLNTMSKFHNYSVNNTLLIHQQKPDATLVAGFQSWASNFDRHVKRGEKGIQIVAPAPYNIKKEQQLIDRKTGNPVFNADGTPKMTEVEVKIPAYKVTTVFDISQTYGKELPTIGVSELTNEVDHAKDFIESLKNVSPVPIEFGKIEGESKGYYSPGNENIMIQEGMSDAQTIKTMVHEISHAKLHNPEALKEAEGKSKGTIEMEAESVAYIVCQHFGIDTSDYSFGYIAGWSEGKGVEELKESMQTIRDTSAEMINRVENNMHALEADRFKAMETAIEETTKAEIEKDEAFVNLSEGTILPIIEEKAPEMKEMKAEKETVKEEKKEKKSLKAKLSEKKKEVAGEKNKTKSKELEKKGGAR